MPFRALAYETNQNLNDVSVLALTFVLCYLYWDLNCHILIYILHIFLQLGILGLIPVLDLLSNLHLLSSKEAIDWILRVGCEIFLLGGNSQCWIACFINITMASCLWSSFRQIFLQSLCTANLCIEKGPYFNVIFQKEFSGDQFGKLFHSTIASLWIQWLGGIGNIFCSYGCFSVTSYGNSWPQEVRLTKKKFSTPAPSPLFSPYPLQFFWVW